MIDSTACLQRLLQQTGFESGGWAPIRGLKLDGAGERHGERRLVFFHVQGQASVGDPLQERHADQQP